MILTSRPHNNLLPAMPRGIRGLRALGITAAQQAALISATAQFTADKAAGLAPLQSTLNTIEQYAPGETLTAGYTAAATPVTASAPATTSVSATNAKAVQAPAAAQPGVTTAASVGACQYQIAGVVADPSIPICVGDYSMTPAQVAAVQASQASTGSSNASSALPGSEDYSGAFAPGVTLPVGVTPATTPAVPNYTSAAVAPVGVSTAAASAPVNALTAAVVPPASAPVASVPTDTNIPAGTTNPLTQAVSTAPGYTGGYSLQNGFTPYAYGQSDTTTYGTTSDGNTQLDTSDGTTATAPSTGLSDTDWLLIGGGLLLLLFLGGKKK